MRVNIYGDGKIYRGYAAELLQQNSFGVEIRYFCDDADKEIDVWFIERQKGCFESEEDNDWYFPGRETSDFKYYAFEHLQSKYATEMFSHIAD